MTRRPPPARAAFARFVPITTRWMDNDAYGHLNNVVYYSFFDTAVNRYLIERGVLRIDTSPVIGLVVETGCRYHQPLSYPDDVEVGIRVAHLGTSSVRYELAIFRPGEETASADGHFTHVYVDRATRKPVPLPDELRAVLEELRTEEADGGVSAGAPGG
ncbi:MAG TPA: thioesterase family protein [Longimicrobium sp.]|nr:thioesterase family protein [Longimicrobium sp.]